MYKEHDDAKQSTPTKLHLNLLKTSLSTAKIIHFCSFIKEMKKN